MSDLDNALDRLDGYEWIEGIDQIANGARALAAASRAGRLNFDATQTSLNLLGDPNEPDVDLPGIFALLVQELTNPKTNPTLAVLPDEPRKTVQQLGESHVLETAYAPRDCPNEAAGLISEHTPTSSEGRCQAVTDAEREELRRKVADVNKRSENRPR
ncbi:hypothetical protein OOK48_35450 [Streptomyces viridodiastaticus]|uniref:hypothetical protein n=1 Tax=Streptomyces albogriseolus TaxID=1887 RepID=UPI00224E5CE9|nr:hypothetical protein [Streptomyces viridodiastaticus]MCX4571618.1 hypothetical protein [Streptomyces viridodiastaticus]